MKYATPWLYGTLTAAYLISVTAYGGTPYTSRPLWQVAAGPSIVENFSTAPLGLLPLNTPTTAGTVTVQLTGSANGSNAFVNGGPVNGSRDFHGFIANGSTTAVSLITFTFPTPVLAWGGDFVSTATGDILVATANGSSYHFDSLCGSPGDCFLGSVETTPFNQIIFSTEVFTSFGEAFNMDNLTYAAVPEPSTLLLLGIGAISLLGYRTR
jgi:PEP-CTERM motif